MNLKMNYRSNKQKNKREITKKCKIQGNEYNI
jgi:hypothetical protein